MIRDLRDWLRTVEAMDELMVVQGAHWDREIGEIAETWGSEAQALLFDRIPGYPEGFRLLSNALRSPSRIAVTLGLEPTHNKMELVRRVRQQLAHWQPIEPQVVKDGPVLENVLTGDDVDLTLFPAPVWHEHDGGRFLGTGCLTTTVDPDEGWVNFGAYRVQIHDAKTGGIYITLGKHGRMMLEKYWAKGEACPVAVSLGHDPLLFMVAGSEVPYGISEYAYAGGLKGEPIEVVPAPVTGIPVPARAEAVIEGWIPPDEVRPEGPFGEWTGYYASGVKDKPVIRVSSICYRNDPILLGAAPGKPPSDSTYYRSPFKAAALWDQMEKAGVPGIQGVWGHEAGGARMVLTVAIKPMYPGHSKQAGFLAAQSHQGAYSNKLVVVVDDDIDPSDWDEVLWAICTRTDFRHGIDILHRNWTTPNDPMHYPEKEQQDVFNSRMIIDACRPWERRHEFPPVASLRPEQKTAVRERWQQLFQQRRSVV